jgi:plastocyanin
MKRLTRSSCGRWGAIALFCAQAATATSVTVSVKTAAGAAAPETLLIFDPLDRAPPPPGHATAFVDQVHKRFVPRVSVVQTGTAVTFPNSDNIRHQVYSFSEAKKFTLKLYAGSPKMDVVFDKPGLAVLGCNIHDTMVAFVGVVDTPYFGKVSDSGALSLDLPPGRYKMRLWNPALAAPVLAQEISIGDSPLTLPLTVSIDPNREAVADWPE